jgi:hypothetical protein
LQSLEARSVEGVLAVLDLMTKYVGPSVVHAGFRNEVVRGTRMREADRTQGAKSKS